MLRHHHRRNVYGPVRTTPSLTCDPSHFSNSPKDQDTIASLLENLPRTDRFSKNRRGIVLTAFFNSVTDPQRPGLIIAINKTSNFLNSASYHNVPVLIFHDQLSDEMMRNLSSQQPNIRFSHVILDHRFSINDFRFLEWRRWVASPSAEYFDWIMTADSTDIIFWKDPFSESEIPRYGTGVEMINQDENILPRNSRWYRKVWNLCFNSTVPMGMKLTFPEHSNTSFLNDGISATRRHAMGPFLDCMARMFEDYAPYYPSPPNCNMYVFNHCIGVTNITTFAAPDFANRPISANCRNRRFTVVHNKCGPPLIWSP